MIIKVRLVILLWGDEHDENNDLYNYNDDGEMTMMLTPEDDPMPDDPKPPWEPKVSRPWSLLASPHRASAPFKESMDGVGDVISPDFCLT